MTIRQQIMGDLYEAMKSRRSDVVSTLRTLLGEIANAEAVEVDRDFVPMIGLTNDVPRKHLTDDDIRQILQAEAERHREAIAEFESMSRQDAVERLQLGLDVITRYIDG
jgi:uncharacterized protein YqeY